ILVKFYEMNGDIIKPNPKSLEKFSDLSNIEDWKKVYIEKAITAKFMNGVTESMFEPDANALREQAIVVLYRMLKAKA
ncbi:MAG: S-layer homology domain-containing protein, partial [Oscillospiraceae bacterium]